MGAQLARLRRRAYIMYKRGHIYGHLPSLNFTIHHLDGHYKKVKRIVEFQMARARRKRFLTSRRETRIGREGHAPTMILHLHIYFIISPYCRFRMVLQVSDATGTTKLTLFDRDAQTLLSTTAVDLLSSQNGDHDHIPPLLQNLCKRTLIFEIQLNDKNLKEGWENFTITKTFAPNQFLEKQIDNNNLTPATSNNNYKASPSITLMDNDIGECNDNETLANMLRRQRKSIEKNRSKKIHYSRNTT
ncbi:hypothetical protein ACFE04_009567 [Oxalis oulophora]